MGPSSILKAISLPSSYHCLSPLPPSSCLLLWLTLLPPSYKDTYDDIGPMQITQDNCSISRNILHGWKHSILSQCQFSPTWFNAVQIKIPPSGASLVVQWLKIRHAKSLFPWRWQPEVLRIRAWKSLGLLRCVCPYSVGRQHIHPEFQTILKIYLTTGRISMKEGSGSGKIPGMTVALSSVAADQGSQWVCEH